MSCNSLGFFATPMPELSTCRYSAARSPKALSYEGIGRYLRIGQDKCKRRSERFWQLSGRL